MATTTSNCRGVRFIGVLCARVLSRVVSTVKQRGKAFEQGGDLGVVQQARGDEELAGPGWDEGRIALDQLIDWVDGPLDHRPALEPLDLVDHRVSGRPERYFTTAHNLAQSAGGLGRQRR